MCQPFGSFLLIVVYVTKERTGCLSQIPSFCYSIPHASRLVLDPSASFSLLASHLDRLTESGDGGKIPDLQTRGLVDSEDLGKDKLGPICLCEPSVDPAAEGPLNLVFVLARADMFMPSQEFRRIFVPR